MTNFVALDRLSLEEVINGGFVSSIQTENLTLAYTLLKAGAEVPLHHHPEEAVDVVIKGLLEMEIGSATDTLSDGMISIVPSNIPHRARAVTDCKVLTIFFPQRNI